MPVNLLSVLILTLCVPSPSERNQDRGDLKRPVQCCAIILNFNANKLLYTNPFAAFIFRSSLNMAAELQIERLPLRDRARDSDERTDGLAKGQKRSSSLAARDTRQIG